MTQIKLEKTKYHRFSLYYDYTPDKVEFCKQLKESFGWQEFSFEATGELKRWVFSNSVLVPVIAEKFPEVQIEPQVATIVSQEQAWSREQEQKNKTIDEVKVKTDTNFNVKGLKKDLYSFQKIGVEFLTASGGRAIIADEMGTGKTAQALAYVKHMNFGRTLVVCPASVKFSWENEIKKWTTLSSVIIDSKTNFSKIDSTVKIWIINYDILKKHHEELSKIRFDCMIGDESQYVKSITALKS